MTDRLADPSDLDGSLLSVLLPLRTTSMRSLRTDPVRVGPGDYDRDPFLAARADRCAPRPARAWTAPSRPPQYHSWAAPVLLAHRTEVLGGDPVVFGRSASTLAERSEDDQPLRMPASVAASLWLVPGMGLVLGWERLAAGAGIAEETDRVGRMLWRSADPVAEAAPPSVPVESDGLPLPLLDLRTGPQAQQSVIDLPECFGKPGGVTLSDLFGDEVDDLRAMVDAGAPLIDLLVPRRTVLAGRQLVEGIVVGLGATSGDLGIDGLLVRGLVGDDVGFDEADDWQQAGFRWTYESQALVAEPARRGAVCAFRSDARVAVVDLDALSIYHDYLGVGGAEIVRELIPVVGVLGQIACDHADVTAALGELALLEGASAGQTGVLQEGLDLARRVRARLELRRLQQPQLVHVDNFRIWTASAALRRVMAAPSLIDELDVRGSTTGDPIAALDRSVGSLEVALSRRIEEQRAADERAQAQARKSQEDRSRRTTAVVEVALGVVSAAGIIGVFAGLASMPGSDREMPSLATAGLWTVLSLMVLGLFARVGLWAVHQNPRRGRRHLRIATALFGACGATAAVGLLGPSGAQTVVLTLACALLLIGAAVALLGYDGGSAAG